MNSTKNLIIYEPTSTIRLYCTANSNPSTHFFWYFNETLINQSSRFLIDQTNLTQFNEYTTSLTIQNASITNVGFYKCTAKNLIGFTSNIFSLKQTSKILKILDLNMSFVESSEGSY